MPDRMTQAVLRLWAGQVAASGRDVVVSRGATSVAMTAVKGTELLKLSEPTGGTRTLRTQNDYLTLASAWGELGEPQKGDVIQDQKEGKAYELLSPGGGEAHWKYTDGTHVLIRAHAKEVPL